MPARTSKSKYIKSNKKVSGGDGGTKGDKCDTINSPSITTDSDNCVCVCADNHEQLSDDSSAEWEIDEEELLHVEINGIFQVTHSKLHAKYLIRRGLGFTQKYIHYTNSI